MLVRLLAISAILLASTAQAGVLSFDASVALNFSALGAGTDQNPVTSIDFGSNSLPGSARFAFNGTDTVADGLFGAGDRARLVGHGLIDVSGFTGVAANSFTAQLRNANLTNAGGGLQVFDVGSLAGGTGLLDLYVKVAPGFDIFDANTSDNGILAATFEITEGVIQPVGNGLPYQNNEGISSTNFIAKLVYNNNGFLSTTGGTAFLSGGLNVSTNIISTDRVVLGGDRSLKNINGANIGATANFSGNTSGLDIGANFNPITFTAGVQYTGPAPFDVVLSADANGAFGVVPEPASIAVFGLLGVGALVAGRRARKN